VQVAGPESTATINVDTRSTVCVARQPILDQLGRVFGYELLYRATSDATSCTAPGDLAGARVLTDALLNLGLDVLTGKRRAFVNFTRGLLLGDAAALLPKESTVIEIREDVTIDDEVIDMCRKLHGAGFALALDDFVPESRAELLLPFASFVKVDVLQVWPVERKRLAQRLKSRGIWLVAEKVETADIAAQCHAVGYRLFQGYYFCRPTTFSASSMPARRAAYLRLLAALNRDDLTFEELDDLIKSDVSLSIRILRSINSWLYGLPQEITSIRHAIAFLGLDQIRKWASVWALAGMNDTGTAETVSVALLRARCAELIGNRLHGSEEGASYFLLGLCSLLDAILNRPMAEAVANMPLSSEIIDALLGKPNAPRAVLDTVIAYERGRWDEAAASMARLGLPDTNFADIYADALRWTRSLAKGGR
jgi:EAL and modified HD-GYP domain-containing signal transduction protein